MSLAPASALIRTTGANVVSTRPAFAGEEVLTLVPLRDESPGSLARRFGTLLSERGCSVLMLMAFGDGAAEPSFTAALGRLSGASEWPLLWVEGASCTSQPIAGLQAFVAARPEGLQRVRVGGRVVGTVFHDGGSRHCFLAGLVPADLEAAPGQQTRQVLEQAADALQQVGFVYGDVARTWFYNDDLLAWYNEFNQARTSFYSKQHFACGSSPASTCVRGRNPRGAALAFAAWATRPSGAGAVVREVASPLQCPAPAYGSSFSRATEVLSKGHERLLISGTASIEPGGRTVWQGDARKQIDLTMEVVAAILESRGFFWPDVTRATAYFKNAADVNLFRAWCADRGLSHLPVVPVCCDICRDDLLFELELDACRAER